MQTAAPAQKTGRPVTVVSISLVTLKVTFENVCATIEREAKTGADLICLPECWRGEAAEQLTGPTITACAQLAGRYHCYLICPIYRLDGAGRFNSSVLLDRKGNVVCVYDKVYPYWSEFSLQPSVVPGSPARVYPADFGRVGMAICFDVNFPEVWQRMAEQDAELVIWPSAYSAGTTLQSHALINHFYIVSATGCADCIVYDITGKELRYEKGEDLNISRITLDLDRGIYHQNFNMDKRDRLLREHGDEVVQEQWLEREQWFVLKAVKPGVSARELARQYGMEELRNYINRSRHEINIIRATYGGQ